MWAIHDERIRRATTSPAVQQLFDIVQTVFGKGGHGLPPGLREARPLVISRDFGTPSWNRRGDPMELYRFQLGPRSWSKPIYTNIPSRIDERVPSYERSAEECARQLKLAGWEKIAARLIDPAAAVSRDESAGAAIQVTLCWQDDGRYCVVHDRQRKEAIAFSWSDDGLSLLGEAHPRRLSLLDSRYASETYERPVLPLDEGAVDLKTAGRAGQMDEFRAAIRWRYETRLDAKLDGLLLEACDRLHRIAGDIGLAFALHRFNDATGDDAWLAVRFGNFAWENGAYFHSNAASLRSAPPEVHELMGLLVHLQSSRVSAAFEQCYGYPVEPLDVMGLFREGGAHYFACCNSHSSCGPVYKIDLERGRTTLYGFTDRFDWNFNTGRRAGGIIPKSDILDLVSLDEVIRRVGTGETPYEAGPPHDMEVPWQAYLPRDPDA
jgi:hypothetical protein